MKTLNEKLRAAALRRLISEKNPALRQKLWETLLANVTLGEWREIKAAMRAVEETCLGSD